MPTSRRPSLWIEDLFARDAAPPKRLTPEGWNVNSPSFSNDGGTVYFLSAKSGSMQLYAISAQGGEPRRLTDFASDVGSYKLSPDGKRVAFSAEAFADCGTDLACSPKRMEEKGKRKNSGMTFDRMFIRHWDAWNDGRLNRVFVTDLGNGKAMSEERDPDRRRRASATYPPSPLAMPDEYAWSPDGKQLVLSARKADREEPASTNFDLYLVNADGSGAAKNLTASNPASDTGPVFSGDGKTLYYRAMSRPQFEADRYALRALDLTAGNVARDRAALGCIRRRDRAVGRRQEHLHARPGTGPASAVLGVDRQWRSEQRRGR